MWLPIVLLTLAGIFYPPLWALAFLFAPISAARSGAGGEALRRTRRRRMA